MPYQYWVYENPVHLVNPVIGKFIILGKRIFPASFSSFSSLTVTSAANLNRNQPAREALLPAAASPNPPTNESE